MEVDYKALLLKYMQHVIELEGCDFIEYANPGIANVPSEVIFTELEIETLNGLSAEAVDCMNRGENHGTA